MRATSDESRRSIVDLYRNACRLGPDHRRTGAGRGGPSAALAGRAACGDAAPDPGAPPQRDRAPSGTRTSRELIDGTVELRPETEPSSCARRTTMWRRATWRGGRTTGTTWSVSRETRRAAERSRPAPARSGRNRCRSRSAACPNHTPVRRGRHEPRTATRTSHSGRNRLPCGSAGDGDDRANPELPTLDEVIESRYGALRAVKTEGRMCIRVGDVPTRE